MNKLSYLIIAASLFFTSLSATGQKTKRRLVAWSVYGYDVTGFYLKDSTHYTYYAPYRGGDLNSIYIPYDVSVLYSYSKTAPTTAVQSIQKFDTHNHRISQTNYKDDKLYIWLENYNSIYTPNLSDSILSEISQVWNNKKRSWDNHYQQISSFDVANNKTSLITYYFDSTLNIWEPYDKLIYEYDVANNLLRKVYHTWNSSKKWDNIFIDSFNYGTTNKPILYTNLLWNKTKGNWEKYKHTVYHYDASDFLIQQTESGWDTNVKSWQNVQQFIFLNNSKGNILARLVQNWDTLSSSWGNFRKKVYTRDSRSNIVNDRRFTWDALADSFVNLEQISYTFDLSNNKLSEVSSVWNVSTTSWDSIERDRYAYNMNNQMTFHTHDMWNSKGYWNYVQDDPIFNYYYEEYIPNSIIETFASIGSLLLYPIPANKNMTIVLKWSNPQAFRVLIRDSYGRLREEWSVPQTNDYKQSINLSGLSSGIYIMECVGANGVSLRQTFNVISE